MTNEFKSEIKQFILESIFNLKTDLNQLHEKCISVISDNDYNDYMECKVNRKPLNNFPPDQIKTFKEYDKIRNKYLEYLGESYIYLNATNKFKPDIIMKKYSVKLKDNIDKKYPNKKTPTLNTIIRWTSYLNIINTIDRLTK